FNLKGNNFFHKSIKNYDIWLIIKASGALGYKGVIPVSQIIRVYFFNIGVNQFIRFLIYFYEQDKVILSSNGFSLSEDEYFKFDRILNKLLVDIANRDPVINKCKTCPNANLYIYFRKFNISIHLYSSGIDCSSGSDWYYNLIDILEKYCENYFEENVIYQGNYNISIYREIIKKLKKIN
ncbi:MAG: hypothetical protein ACPL7I_06965, partial [Myxococcota bacterium]